VRGGVSSDVLTIGQLTYIRAAVMTHNRYVPPSVGKRVDYGHATPDILRAHFAAKYSDIGDDKLDPGDTIASGAIKIIMTLARDRRIPHGYTPDQERIITYWLGVLNACFRAHDGVGTMRVWLTKMGNQLIDSIARANVNPTYLTWLKDNKPELDAFRKEQHEKRYALATLGLNFTFDDSYK
jgi:hypothetical protein